MDIDIDFDIDESFGLQGSVPFKWEIKPGVPKNTHHHGHCHCHCRRSHNNSPPPKLNPPPSAAAGSPFSRSVHSSPRTRSDSWRFSPSTLSQPDRVSPGSGCFPSPLLKRKPSKNSIQNKPRSGFLPEPDYRSELETRSRWSVSSRKSISPFRESLSSSPSSFSSYQSSPRPTSDSEWAGFGLF